MEQKTERFFSDVEQLLKRQISVSEFENLLEEWEELISVHCFKENNPRQTFLNLHHLRLTVKWFIQQDHTNKSEHLKKFLKYLIKCITVELQSLTMHHATEEEAHENKKTQNDTIRWTANKRSLIELICALDNAKCINEGNISTQKIVVLFSELFDVNLDNYYSEINKIAIRKPLNNKDKRAYFLTELADGFNEKMLKLK